MHVLLPDSGGPWPVFYLLHGLSDDFTKWTRNTSIERYAADYPFAIVMPDGFRGCYTNNEQGPRYFDYMVEDVVGFVERSFRVRTDRGGRCVGGLSMGGYGSMLLGLRRPDLFNSVVSHSGAMQLGSMEHGQYKGTLPGDDFIRIFTSDPRGSEHDLMQLAKDVAASDGPRPHLRIDCGVDDFLLDHNRGFHAHLNSIGYAHEYAECPGEHNWAYWDEHVREALAFHAKHLASGEGTP